jgi:microcystin degradation protein MlrC
MRVFVAGMEHETNSFSPIATDFESFANCLLLRPSQMSRDAYEASVSGFPGLGTFMQLANLRGHEAIAGLATFAKPSAPASRLTFETLRDEIVGDLVAAGSVDFVLLYLHGAQMADGYPDCEGALLRDVRSIVGPDVPIGVLLDLHGNVSRAMIENSTILMGCLEYPHTDFAERASHLFEEIERVARGRPAPYCSFVRVPMLALQHTARDPMRALVMRARAAQQGGVRAISLMHGFPWSDSPDTGSCVLVYGDKPAEADALAARFASDFFELRNDVRSRLLAPEDALTAALDGPRHPIVIADGADNVGGGAASDSTFLLHALAARRITNAGVGVVWDPRALEQVRSAGIGATLTLEIGGHHGPMSGPPFVAQVRVLGIGDDVDQDAYFERAGWGAGAAAVDADGIIILISGTRRQFVDPRAFTQFGIDPLSLQVIIVKSMQHFYERFLPIAAGILYARTPGSVSQEFEKLPYRHLTGPIWPLKPDLIFAGDFS